MWNVLSLPDHIGEAFLFIGLEAGRSKIEVDVEY
jgi:hypothetical protein